MEKGEGGEGGKRNREKKVKLQRSLIWRCAHESIVLVLTHQNTASQ